MGVILPWLRPCQAKDCNVANLKVGERFLAASIWHLRTLAQTSFVFFLWSLIFLIGYLPAAKLWSYSSTRVIFWNAAKS